MLLDSSEDENVADNNFLFIAHDKPRNSFYINQDKKKSRKKFVDTSYWNTDTQELVTKYEKFTKVAENYEDVGFPDALWMDFEYIICWYNKLVSTDIAKLTCNPENDFCYTITVDDVCIMLCLKDHEVIEESDICMGHEKFCKWMARIVYDDTTQLVNPKLMTDFLKQTEVDPISRALFLTSTGIVVPTECDFSRPVLQYKYWFKLFGLLQD